MMPTSVRGMGAMMTQRHDKGAEPADHKHVDEYPAPRRIARRTMVAEDFDGDMPFAVPTSSSNDPVDSGIDAL